VAKLKCPDFEKQLELMPCTGGELCDDQPCSRAQHLEAIETWLASAEQRQAADHIERVGWVPSYDAMFYAALSVQAPLSPAARTRLARRSYDIKIAPEVKLLCDERLPAGTPCDCRLERNRNAFCRLPLGGGFSRLEDLRCEVKVDDKARLVGWARKVCSGAGGTCSSESDCCPDLACEASVCAVPRPADAGP